MGKAMMGGTTRGKDISMLTPEQQALFSSVLGQLGPDFTQSFGSFLQPQSQEQMDATFQKSYVDPAMLAYEQRTIPGIQQAFGDANAGSSSALNQALASSASDLSTNLGAQYGQYQQNQQLQQLNAISQFLPLLTGQTFSPQFRQQQGLAGPLIQATGNLGAGYLMGSSEKIKENVKDYAKGLDVIENLEVKQYDYKQEYGGLKDKVGMIAETLPKEMTELRNDILHVDLYGIIGLLVNSVKELNEEIKKLKE